MELQTQTTKPKRKDKPTRKDKPKRLPKAERGLEIVEEIKEPFSFSRFFEVHIKDNIKRAKRFLERKGVLGFLLSPFQYRSRLLVKILLIVFGILLGVVPRGQHLIQAAKIRNAGSELATISEEVFSQGALTIKPLKSSQKDKTHVLAFLLSGTAEDGVSARTKDYTVKLSPNRGVSDGGSVWYRYQVVPLDDKQRILLLYVDRTKQDDTTGIWNLSILEKGKAVKYPAVMEVVLSDTQKTNDLYQGGPVNLSSLSFAVFPGKTEPIKEAKEELEAALKSYRIEADRLATLPEEIKVTPSYKEMVDFTKKGQVLPDFTDASDASDMEGVGPKVLLPLTRETVQFSLDYQGEDYDSVRMNLVQQKLASEGQVRSTLTEASTDADPVEEGSDNTLEVTPENASETMLEEQTANLPDLSEAQMKVLLDANNAMTRAFDGVSSALSRVNSATLSRYNALLPYKLILTQELKPGDFEVTVK